MLPQLALNITLTELFFPKLIIFYGFVPKTQKKPPKNPQKTTKHCLMINRRKILSPQNFPCTSNQQK